MFYKERFVRNDFLRHFLTSQIFEKFKEQTSSHFLENLGTQYFRDGYLKERVDTHDYEISY